MWVRTGKQTEEKQELTQEQAMVPGTESMVSEQKQDQRAMTENGKN